MKNKLKKKTPITTKKKKIDPNDSLFAEYTNCVDKDEKIKIRNKIVVQNRPLVMYIINKYHSRSISDSIRQELIQEGCIGLMHAVEAFKPSLGFKFSTYSVWWIRQRLNNYMSNIRPMIRIPSHVQNAYSKLYQKLRLEGKDFSDISKIVPEDYDINEKMMGSIQDSISTKRMVSISAPIGNYSENDSYTVADIIADEKTEVQNNENDTDLEAMIEAVAEALSFMDVKKRNILLLRFGIINSVPQDERRKRKSSPKSLIKELKKKSSQNPYITLRDGGNDFRKMAKIMNDAGYPMNHATARNIMISAIEQVLTHASDKLGTDLTKSEIKRIASSQGFQDNLQDVLYLAHKKYLTDKGMEN